MQPNNVMGALHVTWFGIRGAYVNSFIMDEGVPVKSPLQG